MVSLIVDVNINGKIKDIAGTINTAQGKEKEKIEGLGSKRINMAYHEPSAHAYKWELPHSIK